MVDLGANDTNVTFLSMLFYFLSIYFSEKMG